MNTARLLVPIFTLQDFLYLLLDFLLAGFRWFLGLLLFTSTHGAICLSDKNFF